MRLKDKVCIITGAGSGIGRVTAVLFAKEGAKLVLNGRREDNTAQTLRLVKETGAQAIAVVGDVAIEADVQTLVAKAIETFGRIDVLFNNAGVGYSSGINFGPVESVPTSEWEKVFAINLDSVFYATKYVLPHMICQKYGVVLNNASINGVVGCGAETYSATKGGMIAFTRACAVENGKHNIRFNCVSPGATDTPMIGELLKTGDFRARWTAAPALKGILSSEDIAYAALFLCSDEAAKITGQNLVVDGGFTIS